MTRCVPLVLLLFTFPLMAQTIHVENGEELCSFAAVCSPLTPITFSIDSDEPLQWDFGDGSPSTLDRTPAHAYAEGYYSAAVLIGGTRVVYRDINATAAPFLRGGVQATPGVIALRSGESADVLLSMRFGPAYGSYFDFSCRPPGVVECSAPPITPGGSASMLHVVAKEQGISLIAYSYVAIGGRHGSSLIGAILVDRPLPQRFEPRRRIARR